MLLQAAIKLLRKRTDRLF